MADSLVDLARSAHFTEGVPLSRGNPAEMRSRRPSFNELMQGLLSRAMGDDRESFRQAGTLLDVANLTPAGAITAADEAGRALANNDMFGMLLGAVGAVPGVGRPVKSIADQAKKGIRAYHGSPHDFDRFSMENIGTGEGAQAYGHGLYFAESEGVAKSYRDALQNWPKTVQGMVKAQGHEIDLDDAREILPIISQARRGEIDAARGAKLVNWRSPKLRAVPEDELTEMVGRLAEREKAGRMYEVNIRADPEEFLDWDRPLSEQPAKVREALKGEGPGTLDVKEVPSGFGVVRNGETVSTHDTIEQARNKMDRMGTAGEIVQDLEGAERRLSEAGVPGIKYLDQGSRQTGEGSRNFVLFSDSIIDIVKKYGIAAAAAMTGLSQAEIAEAAGSINTEE